ncbi:MAG TPA: adenylate/guanylate cyclase domain-containing protein [Caldilineaceae bacterium]|nr:adenylate/guanylate cyclase domain-containing protein [Caldilineaceae bacterium]
MRSDTLLAISSWLPHAGSAIATLGIAPGDSEDLRIQKTVLVRSSLLICCAGVVWGALYFVLGQLLAGLIPWGYSLCSTLNLAVFARTRHFDGFRFIQLLLILLLPIMLMWALGGFITGSAVILWALLCPLGALLFCTPLRAHGWFCAYLVLLVATGLIHPFLPSNSSLAPWLMVFFFVLNIGAVSLVAYLLLHTFLREKEKIFALLRLEQAKTERLLLNVLPKEIATILREQDERSAGTIAEHFDQISVLFADVVGFTPLSAKLAPAEMVELLNEVFSYFDQLVDKYHVEKIRTIGDNYMVVAGAPTPRADHARALACVALEMMAYIERSPTTRKHGLRFRIGMNCGPAVGGVIGHHKFHYDVWGDTVNVASRMESQGVPGKIQITPTMQELLYHEFVCRLRGPVEIKGVGEMHTWFLEDIRSPDRLDGAGFDPVLPQQTDPRASVQPH